MNNRIWKKRNIPLLLVVFIVVLIFFVIQSFRIPYEARQVKVGAVLVGSKVDGGWNESHYKGIMKACQEYDCELKVREYVHESAHESAFYDAVEELIDEGANVIFLTSFGYGTYMDKIAAQHPNVAFFGISGHGKGKNSTSYFARIYQVRYLAGIVAGAATKTGILGYVAAMPNAQTNRGINAYALGMRKANPQAKLLVSFTGSWDDENAQREKVHRLAEAGADVITYHEDKPHAIQKAEAMGLYSTGYGSTREKYSSRYLTAALYDWDVVYARVLGDYMSGRVNMSREYWLGLADGGVRLDNLSSMVSTQTRELVEQELQSIRNQDVFTGMIYDNEGRLRCEDGEQISDHELFYGMDWFVEGVEIDD